MRIAVVHFGKRGAGPTYSLEMAKALRRLGHSIFYYCSSNAENMKYVENEDFELRKFNTYISKFTYLKSIVLKNSISKVIDCIKSDHPDVVYSPMPDLWSPFVFPKLKGFLRVKTIHDAGIHEGNNSLFNKWWNRTSFRDAEKYIILSKKFESKLEEYGIDRYNICVIPHAGFDFYTKNSIVNKSNEIKSDLLFFGRIDEYKGIPILLKAMNIVIQNYPSVLLYIVGNGKMKESDLTIINSMSRNIKLINRWIKDEEVSSYFESTNFIVLPYIHATQSGIIPLAYAYSKPVIATNVGGLDEQIIDGETGILIPPKDVTALAESIMLLLSDKTKTKKMGIAAHSYMTQNLTWDSSAHLFEKFIKI